MYPIFISVVYLIRESCFKNFQYRQCHLQVMCFRVTFEDGRIATEKKSSTGTFEYSDEIDEETEGVEPNVLAASSSQTTANASLDDGVCIFTDLTKPKNLHVNVSKRQLKKRLRLQRLGYVVDLKPDYQMANVSDGVYLGSQDVAHHCELLKSHHITHIINCASGVRNVFEGRIKYLNVDALDLPSMNISQYFAECHSFMRKAIEAGGNLMAIRKFRFQADFSQEQFCQLVLVHCNAGVSRSATIVVSYVMKYDRKSLKDALEQVNSVRRGIVLLVTFIHAALIPDVYSAVMTMYAKTGENVTLTFGTTIKDVFVSKNGEKVLIVEGGEFTEYGRKLFGDRASFAKGTLTLKNIQQSDLQNYYYKLYNHDMTVNLQDKTVLEEMTAGGRLPPH
ncbi:unnamed protein product [Anisakis simplex]|uniref:Protein-tyrosine-phosphatase n=1 Tax=Anisakis simplex TaxID=6269 RepID=A0A0M3JSP9_ANISI|nr:unnamed protein product [Anisakis simplex]